MKQRSQSFLLVLSFALGLAFLPSVVWAQEAEEEACGSATVRFTALSAEGAIIPQAVSFEFYEQAYDAHGSPRPGKKAAGGKTSATLGWGEVKFAPKAGTYALKVAVIAQAPYYYYDQAVECGQENGITKNLSGMRWEFRDTVKELIKHKSFSIYSERHDVDGKPIHEKQDFIGTFNTSEEGEAFVFVPAGARHLDDRLADYFMMEMAGPAGGTYRLWDIRVADGRIEDMLYEISDMLVSLEDKTGQPYPGNTKLEIYKQAYEDDDEDKPVLGGFVKEILTDDRGQAVFTWPAGLYAARLKGPTDVYQYFWELKITDQDREEYELETSDNWIAAPGKCSAKTALTVDLRGHDGNFIPGLKYELYEQSTDADGAVVPGVKALSGEIDKNGKGYHEFSPNPLKTYALKVYDLNPNLGEQWTFNVLKIDCGGSATISRTMPAVRLTMRNGAGELVKGRKFSVYTQRHDIDGAMIKEKEDLVNSSLVTPAEGEAVFYLGADHPLDPSKKGTYVITTTGENGAPFTLYDIRVSNERDLQLDFVFSDLLVTAIGADDRYLANATVELYEQKRDLAGEYALGKLLKSGKTDANGNWRLEYQAGTYALALKDGLGKSNPFWNSRIVDQKRSEFSLKTNLARIFPKNGDGAALPKGTAINLYRLTKDINGRYYRDVKLKALSSTANGYAELALAPNAYLAVLNNGGREYGAAFFALNGKLQNINLQIAPGNVTGPDKRYELGNPGATALSNKLKGYILLQVESRGEAWYINPKDQKRYYMKDGETAYGAMRRFGVGVTNNDLKKVPIGINVRSEEYDYDGDQLHDKMEEALGTDMYDEDTDGDGFEDGVEAKNGFDPKGTGRLPIDTNFANSQKGKILLQVESRGEAWYINPKDGRRYYMKDGESAYQIMRFLSLGAKDSDLEEIEEGVE